MSVVLVFVLDGPGRPPLKRGKKVNPVPMWITPYLEELVNGFGFFIHQAPGEADAELAKLNSAGMIDAIITDDSDVLVFGGQSVICRSPIAKSDDYDSVILYTVDNVEHSDGVKLTRGGLLLLALLVGGDYDPGIDGCGAVVAQALAECGFGDELLDAVLTSKGPDDLQRFLEKWRHELRHELLSNSHHHLKHRKPSLACKITNDFPDLAVLKQYVDPLTSWSSQSGCHIPDGVAWRSREPMIPRIAAFCVQRFGWGKDAEIVKRLHAKLWEGVAFRMICSPLVRYDSTRRLVSTPATNATIVSHKRSMIAAAHLTPSLRVVVSTGNFQDLMGVPWSNVSYKESIPVHIPISILQFRIPSLYRDLGSHKLKRKQNMSAAFLSGSVSTKDRYNHTPAERLPVTREVIEVSDDEADGKVLKVGHALSLQIIELTDSDGSDGHGTIDLT
ncbi:DNA repair protein complementing XP-G cells [Hypsizygus marmoreus]|uniref:DNA repair protein complementing XP-G cells n=1 Tax=Hypsizygus marmoreus TaxID=39966 RepID=A0A369J8R3_HYPMA|nr:DNA repair protein complementing XP-G cells [Hypsizygus marmoreus]